MINVEVITRPYRTFEVPYESDIKDVWDLRKNIGKKIQVKGREIKETDLIPIDIVFKVRGMITDAGFYYPEPDDTHFEWRLKTDRGSFTKRLQLWMKKNNGGEIHQDLLTKIGTVLAQELKSIESGYFTVIDKGPYHFGSKKLYNRSNGESKYLFLGGSCWWQDTYAVDAKQQYRWWEKWGGFVLKIYSDERMLCSDAGRAWLWQINPEAWGVGNLKLRKTHDIEQFKEQFLKLFEAKSKPLTVNNRGVTCSSINFNRVGIYDSCFVMGTERGLKAAPNSVQICSKTDNYPVEETNIQDIAAQEYLARKKYSYYTDMDTFDKVNAKVLASKKYKFIR